VVAARAAAHREQSRVDDAAARLARCATAVLHGADRRIDEAALRLTTTSQRRLADAGARIDLLATRADLLDPGHVLARGWSIARRVDGAVVRSVDDVDVGTVLILRVGDGSLHATVGRIDHDEPS
jgi:exonuclease VII large subunit